MGRTSSFDPHFVCLKKIWLSNEMNSVHSRVPIAIDNVIIFQCQPPKGSKSMHHVFIMENKKYSFMCARYSR